MIEIPIAIGRREPCQHPDLIMLDEKVDHGPKWEMADICWLCGEQGEDFTPVRDGWDSAFLLVLQQEHTPDVIVRFNRRIEGCKRTGAVE